MARLLLILLLCLPALPGIAQFHPNYTQYMQNSFLVNPAVAGIEPYADVRAGYRSQWVGVDGAPVSYYATMHAALGKGDRNMTPLNRLPGALNNSSNANKNNRFYNRPHHGLGAIVQTDKAGLLRASSINLNYAYHLPLTDGINLSGGASAGIAQFHLDRNNVVLQRPDDPFLHADFTNMLKFDLGLGLWLYGENFYLGASGKQLLMNDKGVQEHPDRPFLKMLPHYYLTGGIRLPVSRDLSLTPSFMAKTVAGGSVALDGNLKATYKQQFWGGASYRHQDAVAVLVGIYVNHLLDISYSHDIPTTDMRRVSANTHEVVLGLKLNNPYRIICPRWLW
jgi:type IX secretion system PorP/SprF family membrane protein